MDLRGLANGVTATVNPNRTVTVRRSTGYTIGAGRKQVPAYADPVTGPAQIQALDANDIKQLDGLNIQGTVRAIYLRGVLAGVVRPDFLSGLCDRERLSNRLLCLLGFLSGLCDRELL